MARTAVRAARRAQRLEAGLLEARPAARLETARRQQQRSALLRILDERLRGRLAAAIVDRLGLEADVHGEQLAAAQAAERDLDVLGGLQVHHAGRARAAVVGVAVDLELALSPQRLRGV